MGEFHRLSSLSLTKMLTRSIPSLNYHNTDTCEIPFPHMRNFLSFAHTLVIFGKLLKPCDFISLSSYLMRAQRPVVLSPTTIITFLLEFPSPAVNFIPTLHSHQMSLTLELSLGSENITFGFYSIFKTLRVWLCGWIIVEWNEEKSTSNWVEIKKGGKGGHGK